MVERNTGNFHIYLSITGAFVFLILQIQQPIYKIVFLVPIIIILSYLLSNNNRIELTTPKKLTLILSGFSLFSIMYVVFGDNNWLIIFSFLLYALVESLSIYINSRNNRKIFSFRQQKNSVIGILCFFLLVLFSLIFLPAIKSTQIFTGNIGGMIINYRFFIECIEIAVVITTLDILTTTVESFLTIPFIVSVLIQILLISGSEKLFISFTLGFFFAVTIALFSQRFLLLSISGSFAQFILAVFIFGFGGWKWTVPILVFFLFSSILSKIRISINNSVESYFEKSNKRDYLQVFANGGIAALLVIFNQLYNSELLYIVYVSSLSAVCADTWATEIGTLRRIKTVNVISLKPVEQGMSGGISWMGIVGSVLGAFIVAISSLNWITINFVFFCFAIVTIGVLSSLIDSIMGAAFQLQYKCKLCGKITERNIHCGGETLYNRGWKFLNNDMVNFITAFSGGVIAILFFVII